MHKKSQKRIKFVAKWFQSKWWFIILFILILSLLGIFLGTWLWQKLQNFNGTNIEKNKLDASIEFAKLLINIASTIVTIIGAVFLYFNFKIANENVEISNKNTNLAESRLILDRFNKAVENLNSSNPHTRIGGIYLLEEISKESEYYHWVVIEILTSFIQKLGTTDLTGRLKFGSGRRKPKSIDKDIKVALTVIGRRNVKHDPEDKFLDFSGAYLVNADFSLNNFRPQTLKKADFSRANLEEANFEGSVLEEVNFLRARLVSANFTNAKLKNIKFRSLLVISDFYCNFEKAIFTRATLNNINFLTLPFSMSGLCDPDRRNRPVDYAASVDDIASG